MYTADTLSRSLSPHTDVDELEEFIILAENFVSSI
jgi:hypothetical protein